MRRLFVLAFTAVFLFGLLASCGGKKTVGNRFEGDKMVISVSNWDVSQSFGSKPDELYQYIQDRFGIVFEPHDLSWDNFSTLPLLWAQAGTLPDIIGGVSFVGGSVFRDWVEAGIIQALPDDLSAYPSLNMWISQDAVQDLAIDGKNYFIPRANSPHPDFEVTALARGLVNRRDWREKLGIPVPQTEEDFLNMWKAFADPANNLNGDGSIIFGILPDQPWVVFGQAFAGHGDTRGDWVMQPDGSMVIPALESSSLPLMSFWRRAYREGLVDPDYITNPVGDVPMKNFVQGRAGTLIRQVIPTHLKRLYDEWIIFHPDIDFNDAIEVLMPPRLPGKTPLFLNGTGFWSETYINADVDAEKLEKILQLYDWLFSEEGVNTMVFGFEGKDWERRDGEIVMLTPVDPGTGMNLTAKDLYQFATDGMGHLAVFADEVVAWEDPNIPKMLRDMSTKTYEIILGPGMGLVQDSTRSSTIANIPEVVQLAVDATGEWAAFMADTSNVSDEELFASFRARWTAAGYDTAKAAMTREAAARGWTY